MLKLRFQIEGVTEMSRVIRGIDDKANNLRPEFQKVGKYLKKFYSNDVFASEGGVIGEKWQGLNPQYASWKAKKYPGKGILVRTGKMKGAFEYKATKTSTTISNPTSYFKYHQSRASRSKIPRRVMMKLDEKRRQTIIQIFRQALKNVL